MSARPSSIFEYLNWLLKKYHEIQQQTQRADAFRIVEIKHNKLNECVVKVQMIGKATVFECTPHEIVANDQVLEGFSKKDIRTLTYFATNEIRKPKYKILVQEFSDVLNKIKFKLGMRGSAEPVEKTAEQISLDKELLNKLNAEDAHLVGFTTATEQMLKEKEEMEKLKKVLSDEPR
jgi:hypothetical protein